jgi:hypothetical protein
MQQWNTTAAFPFSNKANWRLDHEDTCFDIRGALERDDCLIRAKPYKLWAKRTFVRGQLRQTGERHLSSASEEWLRHLCLPAIRAPLSTSPSPASSILVVSCHGLRNESSATDRWHRAARGGPMSILKLSPAVGEAIWFGPVEGPAGRCSFRA